MDKFLGQRERRGDYFNETGSFQMKAYLSDIWGIFVSAADMSVTVNHQQFEKFCLDNNFKVHNFTDNCLDSSEIIVPEYYIHDEEYIALRLRANKHGQTIYFYFVGRDVGEKYAKLFKENFPKENKSKTKVGFILHQHGETFVEDLPIKPVEIDCDLYYENLQYDKIVEILNSDGSGLLFFSGEPGTGKTSLIKYLTGVVNKKFIYLPSTMVDTLTSPGFLTFAITELANSILIVEDGEKVLSTQGGQRTDAISTILNITDGILGDALNVKVITTQNNIENTDEAILRKGRLLLKQEFTKISAEKANKIIGSDKYTSPVTLADIFNEDNNSKKSENSIGFKMK